MDRCILANLPTPIVPLRRLSEKYGVEIWMKRDDYTGTELSGNKIRKLEYLGAHALKEGANHLITCGGIQSNHARATAMVAARLGMKVTLVLRGTEADSHEGNPFLSRMAGAKFVFITPEEYRDHRGEIMAKIADDLIQEGAVPYVIPEGASNSIGSLGYVNCYEEIVEQERELEFSFDRIAVAVGSGGTVAGLLYGNYRHGAPVRVWGVPICDDAAYFSPIIAGLTQGLEEIHEDTCGATPDKIRLIDGYAGLGYAISRSEELALIKEVAQLEGIILDPVYTGKAFYGLIEEIKAGRIKDERILFIHTGGLLGYQHEQIAQMENS